MIHVKYEKEKNYPHNRELILFDRNAFQKIHRDVLLEVNKRYNILCPQVFVMECIAPNNTDKKIRRRTGRYLHYLNFCDIFVADEPSTPHIVESIPYSNIKTTPVITSEELKERLN